MVEKRKEINTAVFVDFQREEVEANTILGQAERQRHRQKLGRPRGRKGDLIYR